MQPCSTAMIGNLSSNVFFFKMLFISVWDINPFQAFEPLIDS